MGRRAQKPRAVALIEVAFAFVAFLFVVSVLLAGSAGLPAIMALFSAIIVTLLCLAGIVLIVWSLRSWWRTHPDARAAVARVLTPSGFTFGSAPPAELQRSGPLPASAPPPPAQQAHPYAAKPTPPPKPVFSSKQLVEEFRNLDWYQFEKIVALIYRKLGHQVERRGGANADGGIDLVLDPATKPVAIQCKHWKTWQIGVKAIREFLGALTAAGLRDGVFVALGKFTPDAATLATRHGIRLVDAADLAELVHRAGVQGDPELQAALTDPRKYCPKCERELVLRTATKGSNIGGQFWGCSGYPRCKYILRI